MDLIGHRIKNRLFCILRIHSNIEFDFSYNQKIN
jgi:hypothetical protein